MATSPLTVLPAAAGVIMEIARDYWPILGSAAAAAWVVCRKAAQRWRQARALWQDLLARVTRIDATLGPNGGASLYDRLGRIETQGAKQSTELALMRARIDADQRATAEPRLELDAEGRVVVVNRSFEALTDRGAGDIIGLGLVGVVHRADRDRVVAEWQYAVRDRRWFELDLRLVARDGTTREARLYAEPMRAAGGETVYGWIVMFSNLEGQL